MNDIEIYHNAPEGATPAQLAEYLEETCGGDANLRAAVEALFQMEERKDIDDFLERPLFSESSGNQRGSLTETAPWSGMDACDRRDPAVRHDSDTAILGDYRLIRKLGQGGFGVVYEAVHIQRQHRVALKTLPVVGGRLPGLRFGDQLHRFKHEFRTLADINHPNLVGLHTLENDGDQWFFTMDLVDGVDFNTYVRPQGVLDGKRLRAALAQLVTGVMALHERHILHCDLKPSNVMVTGDGKVLILDFGLVVDQSKLNTMDSDVFAGTPAYAAPERWTSEGLPASDWYSVGVMLYESLSGRQPFMGDMTAQFEKRLKVDLLPLPANPELRDLSELCLSLLVPVPRDRPDSAGIAKVLSKNLLVPPRNSGEPGDRLIGRSVHLAKLQSALDSFGRSSEPLTVFISGRSGEGKTILAERFLDSLRRSQRYTVLTGRCYDRESVPFKALDRVIDDLCSYLRSLSANDAARLMPDDIAFLAHLFPTLQRVDAVARAPSVQVDVLKRTQVRRRAFGALRALLNRMSAKSPVILFIDDLQWGDADSAQFIHEVLSPPEAPSVLFIGGFRSDEVDDSPFLSEWTAIQNSQKAGLPEQKIAVGPLSLEESTEMTISLMGKDTQVIRELAVSFFEETGGNPYFLQELITCFDPEKETFRSMPLHEVIVRKLESLPGEAGGLLEVVAVSGQPLTLEEASLAAGRGRPAMDTATRMRTENLLRVTGNAERPLIDTYHDTIRETILGLMDTSHRGVLHLNLAEAIVEQEGGVPEDLVASLERGESAAGKHHGVVSRSYDLAYHYDAAGEKRKAWPAALLAAEEARRRSALDVASWCYDLASRNAIGTTRMARFRIAVGQGESLLLTGKYETAQRALRQGLEFADDSLAQARISALQGDLDFKRAAIVPSIERFEQALRLLGVRVPRTRLGFGLAAAVEIIIQFGHSAFPKLCRLYQKEPDERLDIINHSLGRLSASYFFHNMIKYQWAHWSGLNRAERNPAAPILAVQYASHSVLMAITGWKKRATKYGLKSVELSRKFDDKFGLASASSNSGVVNYWLGDFEEALRLLTESVELFTHCGDMWQTNLAHFHLGLCHYKMGNLKEAIREGQWTFESSIRIGENARAHCAAYLLSRATGGNLPFAELESCYRTNPDDVLSTFHGIMAEGHWHLYHERTEEALDAFEKAYKLVMNNQVMNGHTATVIPTRVTALRRRADAIQEENPGAGGKLRRLALRRAKWACRITRLLFRLDYPHALRELAQLHADMGRPERALKYAEQSCHIADAMKARIDYAESLLVRGRIASRLGLAEGTEQVQVAERELEGFREAIGHPDFLRSGKAALAT